MGNTSSIPAFSIPCKRTKSLTASSCWIRVSLVKMYCVDSTAAPEIFQEAHTIPTCRWNGIPPSVPGQEWSNRRSGYSWCSWSVLLYLGTVIVLENNNNVDCTAKHKMKAIYTAKSKKALRNPNFLGLLKCGSHLLAHTWASRAVQHGVLFTRSGI